MSNILVRGLQYGFYLLLLTPLLYQPTSLYPFLTVKLAVFQVLVELMLAAYIFLIIFEPRFRPKLTSLFLSFSTFIFAIFFSGWWGVDWRASLWSFPERAIGSFTLLHFWALFVILVGLGREISWRQLILFSFVVSLVVALSVFWFGEVSRPGGVLGNPNFLSAYLLINFFLGLYIWKEWPWLIGAGLVLQLAVIFLTQTRGALLGLLIGLIWIGGQWLWRKKKIWAGIFLLLPIVLGGGFWLTKGADVWQLVPVVDRFTDASFWQTVQPRLNAWEVGWSGFQERPVLGWGWENFDKVVNKYYEAKRWQQSGGDIFFSKPHNIIVEYAIAGGVILLTAFLIFFGAAFYKTKNYFLQGALLAYLVPNLFSLDSFGTHLMLMIILALANSEFGEVRSNTKLYYLDGRPVSKVKFLIPIILAISSIYFVNWKIWLADYYATRGRWTEAVAFKSPYRDFLLKNSEAMAELEKAIERRPLDYFLRLAYAEAAVRLSSTDKKFLEKAEEYLQEALQISPNHPQAYYVWAKLKVKNGDREGLEKIMDQAVRLNPDSGDTHFFYGIFYLQLGDVKMGSDELILAKKLDRPPLTPAEAKLLAGYFGDAGLYQEAIHYYRRALIYDYQDQEALFKLALVYYYNNDRDRAKLFFNQLLSRYPSFRESVDFQKIKLILEQL